MSVARQILLRTRLLLHWRSFNNVLPKYFSIVKCSSLCNNPVESLVNFAQPRNLLYNSTYLPAKSNVNEHGEEHNGKPGSSRQLIVMMGFIGLLSGGDERKGKEVETGEDKIIYTIKLAILSQQRQDFKKAEQLFHVALRMAQDLQHRQAQVYIIDEMANNAYELGDLRKAERLFKETIKNLLSDGMHQDDLAIIHISGKLASLYAHFKEDVKAFEGFRFCIDRLKSKVDNGADDFDTLALYSLILLWFGEFEYGRRFLVQSLDLFKKSHEISLRINGPYHHHSLHLLNNMAGSYSLLNRLEEAVQCLQEAIKIVRENSLDDGEKHIPYYYINLANVYLTQLNNFNPEREDILERAFKSCKEAIRRARQIGDKEALNEANRCMATIKENKLSQ